MREEARAQRKVRKALLATETSEQHTHTEASWPAEVPAYLGRAEGSSSGRKDATLKPLLFLSSLQPRQEASLPPPNCKASRPLSETQQGCKSGGRKELSCVFPAWSDRNTHCQSRRLGKPSATVDGFFRGRG